jgi:hypothetical protein
MKKDIKIKNSEDDKISSNKIILSDFAKKKLNYINGSCISRNFPNELPTKEWAGAVLDLLEELKLDKLIYD